MKKQPDSGWNHPASSRRQAYAHLTPAEKITYDLIQSGLSRVEVAKRLGVAKHTIHQRMANINAKIQCHLVED